MSSQVVACPACSTKNRVPSAAKGKPQCQSCKQPLPWITTADDNSFDEIADSSSMAVLVDLWAPWCGPCRQLSPVLETIAREQAGKLKLVKVNVDHSPKLMRQVSARSIPTLVLLKGGKQVGRQVGAQPITPLRRWVESNVR